MHAYGTYVHVPLLHIIQATYILINIIAIDSLQTLENQLTNL